MSIGQRKEDHRRYKDAGEGEEDTDGGDSYQWYCGTGFFGESVFKLCSGGDGSLR